MIYVRPQVDAVSYIEAEVSAVRYVGLSASFESVYLRVSVIDPIVFINRPFDVDVTVTNNTSESVNWLAVQLSTGQGVSGFGAGPTVIPFIAPRSSETIRGIVTCTAKGDVQITFTAGRLSVTRSVHVAHIDGIFWQTLNANVDYRSRWELLGVTGTMFQWVAVGTTVEEMASFLPNDLVSIPNKYSKTLNISDVATYPWAEDIIIGLAGFWGESTSRANTALMTTWATEIASLSWPTNVSGYYFPLEIDPTWTDAPTVMQSVFSALPRPLYVSAYYGNNVNTAEAAAWLASFIPSDVTLLFQDGVGAFNVSVPEAAIRINQLIAAFPANKVEIILEAFRVNPNYAGVDGTYFLPATANQILEQAASFSKLGKVWAFDGPSYITSKIIQEMLAVVPVASPINLRATRSLTGLISFRWSSGSSGTGASVTGYKVNVFDFSGNTTIRSYTTPFVQSATNSYQQAYLRPDVAADFPGVDLQFIVFTVQEIGLNGFLSDASYQFAGFSEMDNSDVSHAVLFAGQSNAYGHFSPLSEISGVQSSATFASSLATQLGLGLESVAAINASLGSSAADKRAADLLPNGTPGSNYWWDLDADVPGPRMDSLIASVTSAGVTPIALVWAQGEADATCANPAFQAGTTLYSDAVRYKAATVKIFAHIRQSLGVANLPIWIQTLGRAYFGELIDPSEPSASIYKSYRDAQVEMAEADPHTRIGSWVASAGDYTGYLPEAAPQPGVYGFIHYLPFVYHEIAIDLATSIASTADRISAPPAWATLQMPQNLAASSAPGGDITVSWSTRLGVAQYAWKLRDISVGNAPVIVSGVTTGTSFVFTAAAQTEIYGFPGVNVYAEVIEKASTYSGPPAVFIGLPTPQ